MKKIEFTNNDIKEIIDLHNQGKYNREIASMFNVSASTIARVLQKSDVLSRHPRLSEERKKQALELYNSGMNLTQVGNALHMSPETVKNVCELCGVSMRSMSDTKSKYSLNKDYFETIDSHEKAYYLGLISADGSVHNNNFYIMLQEKDRHILESFNSAIGSNRKLTFIDKRSKNINHQDCYALYVVNKYFVDCLRQYGIVENKSQCLQFPKQLKKEYYQSYLLGYLDGDGTISKTEKRCSIVGTKSFCESVSTIVEDMLGVHCGVYCCHDNQNSNTRTLQIAGGRQVKLFLDWLYKYSPVYLIRKYQIYQQLYCA